MSGMKHEGPGVGTKIPGQRGQELCYKARRI